MMHVMVSGPIPTECPDDRAHHWDCDSLSHFTPSKQPRTSKEAMESECIPKTTQASNDRAYNEFMTHYEGTTDAGRQPVLPA